MPDYLVGEKIDINGDGTPLRYMDKPSKDGASRDSWSSTLGSVDVHYSSGPANHFFYLLSEGSGAKTVNGVSYDSPTYDGRPVTGSASRTPRDLVPRADDVHDLDDQLRRRPHRHPAAAADLFGAYSPTYLAVADAWAAINVGNASRSASTSPRSATGPAVSTRRSASSWRRTPPTRVPR